MVSAGVGFLSHRINLDYRGWRVLMIVHLKVDDWSKSYDQPDFQINQFIRLTETRLNRWVSMWFLLLSIEGIPKLYKNKEE